jgi:predicted RNA methylase
MRPASTWLANVKGCKPSEIYGDYALGTFALAYHFEMISDSKRIAGFRKAISHLVAESDIVLDIGTGSGVFALLAAEKARRVYAVEMDHSLATVAANNFRLSRYSDKLTLIVGDATNIILPEKVDVIICEMIDTALLNEPQIPVLRSIRQWLNPGGRLIPCACRTIGELVHCNFQPIPEVPPMYVAHYERDDLPQARPLSTKGDIFFADFYTDLPDKVDESFMLEVTESGIANGLRVETITLFGDGTELNACPTLNCPIVFPLSNPISVCKSDRVLTRAAFNHFGDFRQVQVSVEQ